ncbi:Elongator complex protein 2 [Spathaspora sp. JA1]|nr:Elongator complex protein 2 [Spathaspora sp. JA1]
MTTSLIEQEAIFIGANKQNFISDYNPDSKLVAYGAANTIALWNPLTHRGVYSTLKGHTGEVTGVRFIPNSPFLVSTAEDNTVVVWKYTDNKYELFQTLSGHEHSVTCISVINPQVFVTGGADKKILIWIFESGEFKLGQEFSVKSNFYPLTLAIQDIAPDQYVLSIGGTTSSVYIYTFQLTNSIISNLVQSAELLGHEDWIKCLEFVTIDQGQNYILASGSQDRYVRLWRLKLNDLIDDTDEDETKLILLSNKQYKFNFGDSSRAAFSFEALIMGHDDWVTGLQWHPSYNQTTSEKKLQLLTSSADTALMIWEMDQDSGIWVCVNRLGEMSIKGASTATGASGGFWSCLWFIENDVQYVLANGKTGSFRVYKSEADSFESVLGVTGAVKDITDLKWGLNGEYFLATSLDQTTRLYAPWKGQVETWHEFARPQIHGYDMICLDNITGSRFVSGGDEKILRVFEMTNSINKLLTRLCGFNVVDETVQLPESASLPVLGLSNKAANEQPEAGDMADQEQQEQAPEEQEDILSTLTTPPLEEYLQRYTLFPEIEKLYGHGYEISCCATNPSGTLIASACRSNNAKHAVIRVFNPKNDNYTDTTLAGYNRQPHTNMADKFPEIESIGDDLPQDEQYDESDFLSRERDLVGDQFTTEQDKELFVDEDDDINEFKEQFPAVEEDQQPEQPAEEDDEEFEAFGSSATSGGVYEESQPLKEWKQRRDLEISEREKANTKKKQDIVDQAQETIDDFYENYNLKKEEHSKQVLTEQEQFLEKRDGFLKRGTLWDRVGELVQEVGELPEHEDRDKSRFKGLLGKLKGKESAPGAGGY